MNQQKVTAETVTPYETLLKGNGKTVVEAQRNVDYSTPGNVVTITLPENSWEGANPYSQVVTLDGYSVTSRTKVDLQPNAMVINQLIANEIYGIYIENNNGVLTAYAVNAAPNTDLVIQTTASEVIA